MTDEDFQRLEIRVQALETLVAFQFATQHMQTSDPAGAVVRLRKLLLESSERATVAPDPASIRPVAAELDRALQRIVDLQDRLPRRLVD